MSEDGPPRLRRPENGNGKRDSSKLGKARADIKEKVSSLKLKKGETSLSSKVSSFKPNKISTGKHEKEGPRKLRVPHTQADKKSSSKDIRTKFLKTIGQKPIWSIIGIIILIILVAGTALWITGDKNQTNISNNTTQHVVNSTNHYNNGNISFDYPAGWNVTNGTSSSLIVSVSQDENNSFSIFQEELLTRNFTYRVAKWRSNVLEKGIIYYEGDLTIDNVTAYELEANYKPGDKVFTTRGIALQKNNTAYFIIFVFDKALLDYKSEMDTVINSFHVNA